MSSIDILLSIDTNLRNYFNDKTTQHFIDVFDVLYFEDGFENLLNNEETKNDINIFLDEFIGLNEWANIIYDIHHPEAYFKKSSLTTRDILSQIRLLMGSISIHYLKTSKKTNISSEITTLKKELKNIKNNISKKNSFKNNLKKDLRKAIKDSYEGDIFWKDNGWCNVSEVLMDYKLIKLED